MISVIIPLYNTEKYIKSCLLSFENQKCKDFEIIVVNDGSKDKSASIVREYADKSDLKIKLIDQENKGVSAARNRGLKSAVGQYICFIDSDDMVAPNYLSDMLGAINSLDCEVAICNYSVVSERQMCNIVNYPTHTITKMDSREAIKRFLYRDISPGIGSCMVKRDVIDGNGLCFAEGYHYGEDIEMIFKILAHSENVAYIRYPLYLYRAHDTSAMSLVDERRLDGLKLMQGLEAYFGRVRPDFAKEFKKYGVARWVWATLWQIAMASDSYDSFVVNANKYNATFYMKRLVTFPRKKVSTSALMYVISPLIYYKIVRKIMTFKKNKRNYCVGSIDESV